MASVNESDGEDPLPTEEEIMITKALFRAALRENIPNLKALLDAGADIEATNALGFKVYDLVQRKDKHKSVEYFTSIGIYEKYHPEVCLSGSVMLEKLTKKDPQLDADYNPDLADTVVENLPKQKDPKLFEALMAAVTNDDVDKLLQLLVKGVDLTMENKAGYTAGKLAHERKKLKCFKLLLKLGLYTPHRRASRPDQVRMLSNRFTV
jgi:ankyrin repeat protein